MATVRHTRENMPRGRTNWKALNKLSDEELDRRTLADRDNPPLTPADLKRLRRVPGVRIIRLTLGLTQEELADRFGLSLATLRDWEQGRTEPDQASSTLLKLIARIPEQVQQALAEKPAIGRRSRREGRPARKKKS